MTELVICRGLPGSGKTTIARQWVADDQTGRARVNRDELRAMTIETKWHADLEPRIVAVRDAAIEALLGMGVSVISDDTNLPQVTARELARIGRGCGAEVRVWDLTDVPLETCIARDTLREPGVGAEVIEGLHKRYLEGKGYPLPLPEDGEGARTLSSRQRTALRLLASGFVSSYTEGSMASLVARGLATDHGRYHASRGHQKRYEITAAGRKEI